MSSVNLFIRKSKTGGALFLVLAVIGVLAIFTAATTMQATSNLGVVSRETQDDQARFVAAAGIQSALARLSAPRSWPSAANPQGQGDVWSCVDYNYEPDHLGLWSSTDPRLHAAVMVYNNTDGAFHRTPQGPDGTAIPAGKILVISKGIIDGKGERRSTTVAALVKPSGLSFDKAAFGGSEIQIAGSLVDSVDSSVAGWTPASYSPYDLTTNPQRKATIASNNPGLDSIIFDNTTQIDGNVNSGPNSVLGAIAYNGSLVTGSDGTLSSAKDFSTVLPPSDATVLGGGGDALYGAGPTTIAGGVYKISGDLTLSPGAELTFSGPTVIFVDGDFTADNAVLNADGRPANLQIFLTGDSSRVAEVRNSEGSLLLAAPNAEATVEGSDIFGSVMGDRVSIINSSLHYDEATENLILGSSSWTTDSYLTQATTESLSVTPPPGGPPPDPLTFNPGPVPTGTGGSNGGSSGGNTNGGSSGGNTNGGSSGGNTNGGSSGGNTNGGSSGGNTNGGNSGGNTNGGSSGGNTNGSGSGGNTNGSGSGNNSGGSGPGHTPRCCLDFSCGPPRCHIY
jgi:hypothetical protein